MPYSDQVDAEPVRAHVQALVDAGMSVVQIQNLSGVNRTCIRVLLGEFPNRAASRQVRALTASRLLRTRLDRGSVIDGLVPAVGVRRRLEALVAIGWPLRDLSDRLGYVAHAIQVGRRALARAETVERVEALYRELSDTPGPSSRAREYALSHGWLPPLWWDDDIIDDPLAEPEGIRLYVHGGRLLLDDVTLPRRERVALMTKRGLTAEQIAERIGTQVRYVQRDRLGLGLTQRDVPYLADVVAPNGRQQLPSADDLQFLLDNGESIVTIARRFHVSEGGVLKALRRASAA